LINLIDFRKIPSTEIVKIALPDESKEIVIVNEVGGITHIIFPKDVWANIMDWQLR
jgi:hypothetical protein